jgi:porin
VDLIASDPFFGGAGYMRFFNLGFAAPPNGLQPPVIMGAIASVSTAPISWTFMVFDPNDRTTDYLPGNLFSDGVNVSVSGKYSGQVSGRSSSITVTGIYSTKDGANLGELLLPSDLKTGNKSGSWHASVQLAHFLHETQPGNGWGVFVKMGASDGNPNPYQGFITGGVGGKGLFASRPSDTFGVGYVYYNFSDALQSSVRPLVKIGDETGVETYYNYAITPWAIIAADLQYVNPAVRGNNDVLAGGMRLRLRF